VGVKKKRARPGVMTSCPSLIVPAIDWQKFGNTCLNALLLAIVTLTAAVRNGKLDQVKIDQREI